jgi:hypothetical protein
LTELTVIALATIHVIVLKTWVFYYSIIIPSNQAINNHRSTVIYCRTDPKTAPAATTTTTTLAIVSYIATKKRTPCTTPKCIHV